MVTKHYLWNKLILAIIFICFIHCQINVKRQPVAGCYKGCEQATLLCAIVVTASQPENSKKPNYVTQSCGTTQCYMGCMGQAIATYQQQAK